MEVQFTINLLLSEMLAADKLLKIYFHMLVDLEKDNKEECEQDKGYKEESKEECILAEDSNLIKEWDFLEDLK